MSGLPNAYWLTASWLIICWRRNTSSTMNCTMAVWYGRHHPRSDGRHFDRHHYHCETHSSPPSDDDCAQRSLHCYFLLPLVSHCKRYQMLPATDIYGMTPGVLSVDACNLYCLLNRSHGVCSMIFGWGQITKHVVPCMELHWVWDFIRLSKQQWVSKSK